MRITKEYCDYCEELAKYKCNLCNMFFCDDCIADHMIDNHTEVIENE